MANDNKQMFEIYKKIKYANTSKTIIFSIPIMNKLRALQKKYAFGKERNFPYMALVGENKKNIVTEIATIVDTNSDNSGCLYMASLSSRNMARAGVKLAKRNISLCGIVRINRFYPPIETTYNMVGNGIKSLMKSFPGLYVITIGREEMIIETVTTLHSGKMAVIPLGWDISKGGCQNDNKKSDKEKS